jgi:sulfur relay (sulfurtransferase) complex TusBCD TusD component (DsrE family)
MKIAMLLKSAPGSAGAARALQTATDMLAQSHTVSLYLLQDAVRLCSGSAGLQALIDKNLSVQVLTHDAELRGISLPSAGQAISGGSYESLIDLLESCDRVVGIL